MLLRNNMSQVVIADMVGVSQPTVSRIRVQDHQAVGDGVGVHQWRLGGGHRTGAAPAGRWHPRFLMGNRPASGQGAVNYSGKRKLQCVSIQVAATCRGDLVAVSLTRSREPVTMRRSSRNAAGVIC